MHSLFLPEHKMPLLLNPVYKFQQRPTLHKRKSNKERNLQLKLMKKFRRLRIIATKILSCVNFKRSNDGHKLLLINEMIVQLSYRIQISQLSQRLMELLLRKMEIQKACNKRVVQQSMINTFKTKRRKQKFILTRKNLLSKESVQDLIWKLVTIIRL